MFMFDFRILFYWEFRILLGMGGGGGGGGVRAERDVTQEGSCQQTWQSVMVGGRWVKKGNFSVT